MSKNAATVRGTIGSELRALRVSRGIRQDHIAKQIGITNSQMSRMESGDFGPWNIDLIKKWYAIFGVAVEIEDDRFTINGKHARSVDSIKPAQLNGKSHRSPRPKSKSKSKRIVRTGKRKR